MENYACNHNLAKIPSQDSALLTAESRYNVFKLNRSFGLWGRSVCRQTGSATEGSDP
jgi:hypothetical protein